MNQAAQPLAEAQAVETIQRLESQLAAAAVPTRQPAGCRGCTGSHKAQHRLTACCRQHQTVQQLQMALSEQARAAESERIDASAWLDALKAQLQHLERWGIAVCVTLCMAETVLVLGQPCGTTCVAAQAEQPRQLDLPGDAGTQ